MDHFDDLPKRDKNHAIESKAEAAFHRRLSASDHLVLQKVDRKDYGTDCELEITDRGSATNIRIHVQLKGTEKEPNTDGSVSVEISRSNLNYLLMHPYSFYVCYHLPSDTLWIRTTESVLRQYEHSGKNWSGQKTLTITFLDPLTEERLKMLAALARSSAFSSRDKRIAHSSARAEDVPAIVKKALPDLHVGEDEKQAADVLSSLYASGADEVISAAFERFESVLGPGHDAMGFCYMAEINLGMAGRGRDPKRIADGISHLASKLETGRYQVGSLHYSIGNGFAALGREEEAVAEYEKALDQLSISDSAELLAQCHKNLGSSLEKLGEQEKAADCYREALRLSPHLAEAHHALGSYCHRKGEYEEALNHFDKVVFLGDTLGKQASVAGWRINVLFHLGDGKSAFREINGLLADTGSAGWIWSWCARQVAIFGRVSVENARLGGAFWERFLKAHPNHAMGRREWLLGKLYLQSEGEDPGSTYAELKAELDAGIEQVESEAIAYLWDRLGHWAQDDENWTEAERCFRKAYDLEGGHYGYCLGTALNFLGRHEESLPILKSQAEEIQPDEKSWFQVAVAFERLGRTLEAIDAYRRAISLNPKYDLAWFNLGGVHWNSGNREEASRTWKTAVALFPGHELTSKLHAELPFVLL